jgi:hypothetical protein
MPIIVGSGEHRYEVIENWGKLPDGWHYGEVAAVGVDSKDNVYVFARSEHPMMVFDRGGSSCDRGAKDCSVARTAYISRRTTRSTAPMMATIRCVG